VLRPVRRLGSALALGAALAGFLAAAAARADVGLAEIPLTALRVVTRDGAAVAASGGRIVVPVDRMYHLMLPAPGALAVDLDATAEGNVSVQYAFYDAKAPASGAWLSTPLRRGRHTVRLPVLLLNGWARSARPFLSFRGAGRLTLHAIRVAPPPRDPEALRSAVDSLAWSTPEVLSTTTINFLTMPMWSEMREVPLARVVAALGAAAAAIFAAAWRWRRRRWRPDLAVAAGALVAVLAFDARFLLRVLPSLDLVPEPDPEARLRDHHRQFPDMGALISVARAAVRRDERVAVRGAPGDWLAPEVICFNLAPRPCVFASASEPEWIGLSGVDRLAPRDVDVFVTLNSREPLPDGFTPVATSGAIGVVARRR